MGSSSNSSGQSSGPNFFDNLAEDLGNLMNGKAGKHSAYDERNANAKSEETGIDREHFLPGGYYGPGGGGYSSRDLHAAGQRHPSEAAGGFDRYGYDHDSSVTAEPIADLTEKARQANAVDHILGSQKSDVLGGDPLSTSNAGKGITLEDDGALSKSAPVEDEQPEASERLGEAQGTAAISLDTPQNPTSADPASAERQNQKQNMQTKQQGLSLSDFRSSLGGKGSPVEDGLFNVPAPAPDDSPMVLGTPKAGAQTSQRKATGQNKRNADVYGSQPADLGLMGRSLLESAEQHVLDIGVGITSSAGKMAQALGVNWGLDINAVNNLQAGIDGLVSDAEDRLASAEVGHFLGDIVGAGIDWGTLGTTGFLSTIGDSVAQGRREGWSDKQQRQDLAYGIGRDLLGGRLGATGKAVAGEVMSSKFGLEALSEAISSGYGLVMDYLRDDKDEAIARKDDF